MNKRYIVYTSLGRDEYSSKEYNFTPDLKSYIFVYRSDNKFNGNEYRYPINSTLRLEILNDV